MDAPRRQEPLYDNDDSITTPSFFVNMEQVKQNCKKMKQIAESRGVWLRPHFKVR